MSIPRGFALVIADADAHGWTWTSWSDPANRTTWLQARHPDWHLDGMLVRLLAVWRDGAWAVGLHRHPLDPVPVGLGALQLRKILAGSLHPRWERPDLNAPRPKSKVPRGDEGTPAHLRWNPEIEAGAQAGMDRIAHYNRTREWT